MEDEEYNYQMPQNDTREEDLERLYPELYKIIYPMVVKIISENTKVITKEVLDEMTDRIYSNVEPEENQVVMPPLKNGDVINPNAKEEFKPMPRQRNRALEDLIRILLLRELIGGGRPPVRPPVRPPFGGGRPPVGPPPRPPFGGGRPPVGPPMRPPFREETRYNF